MDFRQITYFMSIYDAGSFTKASHDRPRPRKAMMLR